MNMLENRPRGRNLAKIVSYGYVIVGIILAIVAFALNSNAGLIELANQGLSLELLLSGVLIYFIFAIVIYLLSAKFKNDSLLWKLYILIALLNLIVIGFSIILIIFSLLLIASADDIRKELN